MAFPDTESFVLTHDPRYQSGRTSPPDGYGPPASLSFDGDCLEYMKQGPVPATELYIHSRSREIVTLYHARLLAAMPEGFLFGTVDEHIAQPTRDELIMLLPGDLYSGGWLDRLCLIGPLSHEEGSLVAAGAWIYQPRELL